MNLKAQNLERARVHVIWAIKRANRFRIATCRRTEEPEKYKKKLEEQKSQDRDIPLLYGGVPCGPISIKFVVFVGLTNGITYAKKDAKMSYGFSRPVGGKTHVSL